MIFEHQLSAKPLSLHWGHKATVGKTNTLAVVTDEHGRL